MYLYPVYKPYFPKGSLQYAHDALDSTWVSSQGIYLDRAKEKLQEMLGISHVILTNNGTSSNHLIAKSLKFKYPYIKDVLVPNSVYVAAWNTFLFNGSSHYMRHLDVDKETWNMDLDEFSKVYYNAQAIMIVHNLGNIINVPELMEKYPQLVFVEDNCEGFGGEYNGFPSGTKSLCSSLSFYGNKNITSGEGGAFITNDNDVYEYANVVSRQGEDQSRKFIHKMLGYNYRMTNVQAAILLGQLDLWPEIQERKWNVFYNYKKFLSNVDNIYFQKEENGTKHSNWIVGIRFSNNPDYETAREFFNPRGIETRPFFYPIGKHNHLRGFWGHSDVANKLSKEIIIFPSYPELTKENISYITTAIKEYRKRLDELQ